MSFIVFFNTFSFAQELPKKNDPIPAVKLKDSAIVSVDTVIKPPIVTKEIDSTKKDSTKKEGFLTGIVKYRASDYVSLNQREKKIYLYNEAEVDYQDMKITAGVIVIDYNKNLVYAGRLKDSTGYTQRPVFKQGDNVIEPDSIVFNTESKKALVFNTRTEQQGFKVYSPRTKKENDSTYFMADARFTTAEDEEDPEYQFVSSKMKFVPGKKMIVGPTYMEIYGVPTPIALPFAFFPMTKKQTSGIIFPSFGEDNTRGYNLQNGGYYFAISDYLDLAVLGDYYTNGSYGLRLESNYALRYKYRGNVSFRYENLLENERGFPDFSQSTVYNIRWSHSQDSKANPNSRFSASVNLGSSTYFQESINQLNQSSFLNNTLASSVSYSKTFPVEPQVNLSLTATHRQNTNTGDIDLTLPTLQLSVGRIYPFAPKTGTKKGAIHNVNLQLSTRGEYSISTTDSIFGKSAMFDDAKTGMKHSIPISTNFKVFDHFSVSTSANLDENWTLKTTKKYYDQTLEEVVSVDQNGFDRYLTYNVGASVGTTIYGMYNFEEKGEDKKLKAIRHVMRPSVSYTINPAFDNYYETYEVIDADGTTSDVEYTRFENSLYGSPGNTYSSSVGLSLGNNLEAKIRAKDSTKTEPEKIFLLNNLNFSTSYNLAADSLNWSPVRVSGGTQILNKKMSINFGMTLNPYALNSNNTVVNTYNINNGGSLFRLTSANVNMSYTLSNESFSGKESEEDKASAQESARSGGRTDDLFGKSQNYADQRLSDGDKNKGDKEENNEFYNYAMPWSLRLAYSANYTNTKREDKISSNSLMFSGDIEFSPRWSIGASSGYDFLNQGFTYTQLRFERDLLSWRMNFTWIPFSERTSWNFFIGIKSNLLKDLKYDKRRQPDKSVGN